MTIKPTKLPHRERYELISEAEYQLQKLKEQTVVVLSPSYWTRAAEQYTLFRNLFSQAGFPLGYMKAIENRYWPPAYEASQLPWYEWHCSLGVVTAGWRKHVISISWPSPEETVRIEIAENWTHYYRDDVGHVHAYTSDKALEFLTKVREALERAANG